MALPDDLLWQTPEEAVRRIALAQLTEAREAQQRLTAPEDVEALHDFRVAIRRLSSTLRAWRAALRGSVRKRDRRALGDLRRATGGGRDAEVALAWIDAQRADAGPEHKPGLDWIGARLRDGQDAGKRHAAKRVRRAFERLADALEDRLAHLETQRDMREERPVGVFGEQLARAVSAAAAEVGEALGHIGEVQDDASQHEARLACKRLRYLAEPFRGQVEAARALVRVCRKLQDVLGDLNDTHVLAPRLEDALEQTAVERAARVRELLHGGFPDRARREAWFTEWPGLIEASERLGQRRDDLFEQLQRDWLEHPERLTEAAAAFASEVSGRIASDQEIERKFLLRALPDAIEARASQSIEIEQGWLPGERLRERLRVVRDGETVRYYRTVKLGRGVRRMELEESTTREVFTTLWPLTRDCRLHKRRLRVREADLVWEIDVFLDRELVLAEVELPSESVELALPSWLAPLVEREVTGESGFSGSELGR
jgi:CHAD domain-containing protein/CYTH domain-containing protein